MHLGKLLSPNHRHNVKAITEFHILLSMGYWAGIIKQCTSYRKAITGEIFVQQKEIHSWYLLHLFCLDLDPSRLWTQRTQSRPNDVAPGYEAIFCRYWSVNLRYFAEITLISYHGGSRYEKKSTISYHRNSFTKTTCGSLHLADCNYSLIQDAP